MDKKEAGNEQVRRKQLKKSTANESVDDKQPSKSVAPQMFKVNSERVSSNAKRSGRKPGNRNVGSNNANKRNVHASNSNKSSANKKNINKGNSNIDKKLETPNIKPESPNKKPQNSSNSAVASNKPLVKEGKTTSNKKSDRLVTSSQSTDTKSGVKPSKAIKKTEHSKADKDYSALLVSQSATGANVTVEDVAKEKNSKNKHKSARKSATLSGLLLTVIVLASMVVLSFIIYHLYNYVAVKPEQSFITSGSIEHTIGAKAMIVRHETVTQSTCKGDLVTKSTEGARVSTGQQLAMVVPSDMTSVVNNLRNTESQISDVQLELIQQGMATGADKIYENIDEQLVPIIDSLRQDSMENNLSNVSSFQSSIEVLISQREELLLQVDFDDERLNDLRRDEKNYENQLERAATIIYASNPGIVSFKIDGNEELLTFDYMLNGDAGEIEDYIKNSVGVITNDNYVNAGDGVARIAKNEEQYLAVMLENNAANTTAFEVDTKHNINIPTEGVTIDKCRVVRENVVGDNLLVVFSTTKHVEDLVDLRSADIEIVISEARGMKVSVASLVNPDYERGIASIYINKSGFVEEVNVIIVDSDREFAIIEPVGDNVSPNLNSVIISNPNSTAAGNKIT